MNKNYRRLAADFGPAVKFKVTPAPFREAQPTAFEQLKQRLLLDLLEQNPGPEENTLLRRAANDAAALAYLTPYPALVLPGLLEETAARALAQNQLQASIRQRSLNLVLEVA